MERSEVRVKPGSALVHWEDGVCDDFSPSGGFSGLFRCKDECTRLQGDAEVERLRRRKQRMKDWREKRNLTFSHTAPGP